MHSQKNEFFNSLLSNVPSPVQPFLRTALKIDGLEELYRHARAVNGSSLSQATLRVLDTSISVPPCDLERIPSTGALIIVSNHPFGLLDGLTLDSLLSEIRADFKVLINSALGEINELRERMIAVDVFGGRDASNQNVRAVRLALDWLRAGHALGVFPSGEVSHWSHRERRVSDPQWSSLPARLAGWTGAPVLPIFFHGANSILFQLAGALHPRLRTARLPAELMNKQGHTVRVRVGSLITAAQLDQCGTYEQVTEYIRARTYALRFRSSVMERRNGLNARKPVPSVGPSRAEKSLFTEIESLQTESHCLASSDAYDLYAARGEEIPALLNEIGRLREVTFRAVGEGTGRALDIDSYDLYYTHLVLWNKQDRAVAGAYRLAWTSDVLPARGVKGLYSSTLFKYRDEFFDRLGPGVELGRSFICAEYQKRYAPLLLLWQGIARCVSRRPEAPVLFGPVSVSSNYCEAAREMVVNFLRERRYRSDLASLVEARRPFRCRTARASEIVTIARSLNSVEDLAAPIRDIDEHSGVPVLLRQYLKLGGRVAAFHVDRNFANSLDGLLIVDLRETPAAVSSRYFSAVEIDALRASADRLVATR